MSPASTSRPAAALALALALTAPARAAPDDFAAETRARAALRGDKVLARSNLSVVVRRGDAELSGVVSSVADGERALALVRAVPGVGGVRSRITVIVPRPPVFVLPDEDEPPTEAESAYPAPQPARPGLLANQDKEAPPPFLPGLPARPPQPAPEEPARPVVVVALHAPSPAEEAPARPPPAGDYLGGAMRRLRLADARFRAVTAEQAGEVLWVRGPAKSSDAVWAMAHALRASRLPGVESVRVRLTQ